jgi:Holliday junction resolvase
MTPEAKVKKAVVSKLKKYGAYYFFPVTGGFGRSGVPDIVVCHRGRFVAIECKAGNNQPTGLQLKNIKEIQAAHGVALIINENTLDWVDLVMQGIDDETNAKRTSAAA